jgi:chromatin structure-remodeling complex subunit RSC9
MVTYEPRQVAPSLVKAVATPANNPGAFRDLIQKQKDALRRNRGIVHPRGMMMPGSTYDHINETFLKEDVAGFTGPNIYVKTVMALTSGVTDEIKYALHHLVKISHERGEKFRFDQFSQLADELLQAICNVSTIWFQHPGWEYTWADRVSDQPNLLNELNGTTDLIRKLRTFPRQPVSAIRDEDFYTAMGNIDAALLVLRNMVLLEENSKYMAGVPLVRDMLTIVLQLPHVAETVEARFNALEVAEQLTKYWALDANDCLYQSLIETIENNASDRGVIITGLWALSRVANTLEAPNTLESIPSDLLTRICQWLLVPDDEIQGACLSFLYQYTAILGNVQRLVELGGMDSLLNVLISFLSHGAVRVPLGERPETPMRAVSDDVSEVLPKLATSIMENICMLPDPKEQSSAW